MLSIHSKLYQMLSWATRLMLVNFIWLGFNLPVIYLVLVSLTVKTIDELYHLIYAILFLLPFLFFPATSALYTIVRQWVIGNKDKNDFSVFWKGYKGNYIRSMLIGVIITGFSIAWVMNYQLAQVEFKSAMFYVYFVLTVFLLAIINAFFADTVHLHLKFFASLKKSIIIGLFFPHYTISIVGVSGVTLYVLYQFHPILLLLYGGVIPVICGFYGYYHLYKRAEKMEQKTMGKVETKNGKALSPY